MARIGFHPVIGQNVIRQNLMGADDTSTDTTYLGMDTNKLTMAAVGIGAVLLLLAFMKRRRRSRSSTVSVSVPAAAPAAATVAK